MHEAKNDNVLCTSQEDGSACQPQKRLAHGLRFIECKVTDLFLHFQKILSFSNEGKNDFLTLNAISWFILLNINTLCCVLLIYH